MQGAELSQCLVRHRKAMNNIEPMHLFGRKHMPRFSVENMPSETSLNVCQALLGNFLRRLIQQRVTDQAVTIL